MRKRLFRNTASCKILNTNFELTYLDIFQYTDTKLSFFAHAEGYLNATYNATVDNAVPRDPQFNYVYQYKDHLGNSSVNHTKNITILNLVKINKCKNNY